MITPVDSTTVLLLLVACFAVAGLFLYVGYISGYRAGYSECRCKPWLDQ